MNRSDLKRNAALLQGSLTKRGYTRWWHTFTGVSSETGESRTFFIEYFINPSYVMVKAGVFPDKNGEGGKQLHAFYSPNALQAATDPMYIRVGDCSFSENHLSGCVEVTSAASRHRSFMTDSGYMEWNLEMHKAISCHTGAIANRFFTAIGALESFWHGEGIRTCFRGSVNLDGISYEVSADTSYGYADKHWGRSFRNPWLQFASNHLVSAKTGKTLKHSALAIVGCCPRFLGFPLKRKLMIQLTYTGEDFEYNFSRPLTLSRCKWKVKETNKRFIWQIMAQNKTSLIKISGSCRKELMMPIRYDSPDGTISKHPLKGSGLGIGTIEIYRRCFDGLKLIDTLTIDHAFCEYQKGE